MRCFVTSRRRKILKSERIASGSWKLPKLLVELGLVPSMAEARRVIEQGGVYVDGERRTQTDIEVGISARSIRCWSRWGSDDLCE